MSRARSGALTRAPGIHAPCEHEPEEHEQRWDEDERADAEPHEKRNERGSLRGRLLDR